MLCTYYSYSIHYSNECLAILTQELSIPFFLFYSGLKPVSLEPYTYTNTTTGYQPISTTTGYQTVSTTTGYQPVSTTTGYQTVSTITGYQPVSTTTGYQPVSTPHGSTPHGSQQSLLGHKPSTPRHLSMKSMFELRRL